MDGPDEGCIGEAYLARKRGRIPKNEAHFTYTFGVELTTLRFVFNITAWNRPIFTSYRGIKDFRN